MRIHIVDILRLQSCPPERLLHRQKCALAIIARCGLVKGITGIAVAAQLTNDLYAPSFGNFLRIIFIPQSRNGNLTFRYIIKMSFQYFFNYSPFSSSPPYC